LSDLSDLSDLPDDFFSVLSDDFLSDFGFLPLGEAGGEDAAARGLKSSSSAAAEAPAAEPGLAESALVGGLESGDGPGPAAAVRADADDDDDDDEAAAVADPPRDPGPSPSSMIALE
jgi:hypothetical protein